jgi:hypothetical protein
MSDPNSIPDLMDFAKSLGPLPDKRYVWDIKSPWISIIFLPRDEEVFLSRGFDAWYYGPTGEDKSVAIKISSHEEGMRWGYTLLMLGVTYEK